MSAKQTLLKWLANNDLEKVLYGLVFLGQKHADLQLQKDAASQFGRFNALESQRNKNLISIENDRLETAHIREALLQIIHSLDDNWTLDGIEIKSISKAAPTTINWKKYAAYFVPAIILIALVAEISTYKRDAAVPPAVIQTPANISTSGNNSPAINAPNGDVNINYGAPQPQKDTTTKHKPSKR